MATRKDKIMLLLKNPPTSLNAVVKGASRHSPCQKKNNVEAKTEAMISNTVGHNFVNTNCGDTISTNFSVSRELSPIDELDKNAKQIEELLLGMANIAPALTDLQDGPSETIVDNNNDGPVMEENQSTSIEITEASVMDCSFDGWEMCADVDAVVTEPKRVSDESDKEESNDKDYVVSEMEQHESEGSGEVDKEVEVEIGKRSRSKRSETDHRNWSKNRNYKKREQGCAYKGKKKENGIWNYSVEKSAKKLKPRCNCKLSEIKTNKKIKCYSITEEARRDIFEDFWKLSWQEKRLFVNTLVVVKPTARRRGAQGDISRRSTSTEFFLKSGHERIRVCKKMFLNTLAVGEIAIKKWAKTNSVEKNQVPDQQKNKVGIEELNKFLDDLPKLESHYCRQNTSKLYLETIWHSKSQLYKAYCRDFCTENNTKPLSRATFSIAFDKKNLSLYQPKKDKCDVCVAFETQNIEKHEYDHHITLKNEARQEKNNDKSSNNEVFTMDLQSVLLCPKSNVSSLYYKTKLIVHNFTIYDIKRQKGYCFLWNETEGRVTANEFSSIIVHFLKQQIAAHPTKYNVDFILYSDGCAAQNRNCVLSNALFNLAIEQNVTIIQKYLLKGHTQMEADSMHSTIEKKLRKTNINVPADYVLVCKKACDKNPYNVNYLSHTFFKNIEGSIQFFRSIRPGRRVGDPQVNDLKAIKYANKNIYYKTRHTDIEWTSFPIRLPLNPECINFNTLPPLYQNRLSIKNEKFQHLQQLKRSLEKDYHTFYDELPHNN